MPKTRADLSRDDKVAQILDRAAARLKEGGYGSLSVAALARELGIAHSAIYWYFPTKDHLVVAAFQHMVHDFLKRKPRNTHDVTEKILWFVEQLGELYPIRATMREQAQRSPVIADYLTELDARLNAMATRVLTPYVPEKEVEMVARSFIAMVQGAFLEGLSRAERERLLRFALDRLIGPQES